MKNSKSLQPVVLHPGSSAALAIVIVIGVICGIELLLSLFVPEVHPVYCLAFLVGLLPVMLIFLLIDALSPARITISTEGVHLRVRRSKAEVDLPWSSFRYMYRLEGYKCCFYLFSPDLLDKEAQVACYKSCVKNKVLPFTHKDCLILNAWNDGNVIDPRIPEHIQKMTWKFCAKL